MIEPNYDIRRIDGTVDKDVTITVNDIWKSSLTILAGQYVTVIVMTNKEKEHEHQHRLDDEGL